MQYQSACCTHRCVAWCQATLHSIRMSQVSKIVWLRDSIEEIEVSKKIKKIGKWLQDEENIIVGEKKIENIGSLSQVSKMVWLRDSIEGIEVKKNQKNWQEASRKSWQKLAKHWRKIGRDILMILFLH